jgi:RNA polymerase sigma factor (sigma-70 family)
VTTKNSHLIQKLTDADHQRIRAYATQKVGQQDAEDVIQDAYLQLLQRDETDTVREPRAFLFRVIANLSIDAWRKSKRKAAPELEDQSVDLESIVCQQPGPEALTSSLLEFDQFLLVLDDLPELQRHAFILKKLEGLTHAEIAQRLGVSTKSVQRYLVEAMECFATRMENFPP